ncbi:MAG: hypothetical protein JNK48_16040 [Bryobacterales bacterium]|nr:hypothetical protein [Bryobacterales bacterium]
MTLSRRAVLAALASGASLCGASKQYAGIAFEVIRNGKSKRRYLLIHGDEQTAREVLREHMKTQEGIAHLVMSEERLVPVPGGKVDPNRLWSREGAEKNLKRVNPEWSDGQIAAELRRLDKERNKLIEAVMPPEGGLLVAVHNNARGYSVKEEAPVSDAVSLKENESPHEFFLATDESDYRILATGPYNVVLQAKGPAEDDGSLSRLMARRRARYVNLECALGKKDRQREMLQWLERNLP